MKPSISAATKWGEMFPGLDMGHEYNAASEASSADEAQIRRQCPYWGNRTFAERGTYWRVSPARAVFVVTPDQFVVDVFPLEVSP